MSHDHTLRSDIETFVTEMQQTFIDQFCGTNAAPYQELVAPTGTGKTHVAMQIIARIQRESPSARVLCLVPAALRVQVIDMLQSIHSAIGGFILDRQKFREIEAAADLADGQWPAGSPVVTSAQFARQDDIAAAIEQAQWDLVVVDESYRLGGRIAGVLRRLADAEHMRRLLLLTATPATDAVVEGVERVDWGPLVAVSIDRLRQSIEEVEVTYVLSRAEQRCLELVNNLYSELEDSSQGNLMRALLKRRARSSLFSLENSVRRLRNRLVHPSTLYEEYFRRLRDQLVDVGKIFGESDDIGKLFDEYDDKDESSQAVDVAVGWNDEGRGIAILIELLACFDVLEQDTKADTLMKVIRNIRGENSIANICVFSEFADTAGYVASVLNTRDIPTEKITGGQSHQGRAEALARFGTSTHCLVITDAAMVGFVLPSISHVIHYDRPERETYREQRMGRVWRFGRTGPLQVLWLREADA